MLEAGIGVIGGSGLYQMEGLENPEECEIQTPFGKPSDAIIRGTLSGRPVFFLARHGRGHRLLPTELNHRANIWALKSLGVRWIVSVGAVGSLKEELPPRHIVIPDQCVDQTSRRAEHTFFGEGIVAHISFGEPYSGPLRELLIEAVREEGLPLHDRGTYTTMDGPAFSTRAESEVNRQLGHDVIGMTNAPEAKLAREAEIALATLAMVTDYDCWKEEEEDVTVDLVLGHLRANAENAQRIVAKVIQRIPRDPVWAEHQALEYAILTEKSLWPEPTKRKLGPILHRFLSETEGSH
ncbi:MAG: S-methyl-5'-thioadenosine phosphorylase [Verrucomicrobiota bacterium]